jgi:hypothetical protein
VFLSERETDTLNICHVWLRREDFERTRADREEEEDDKHDAPKKADEKKTPCASRSTSMTFTCACG